MPRPRICHIAATTEGAAWVHEQLRDLRDRHGFDVTVILNGDKGKLVDRFNASGIRVLHTDFDFIGSGDLLSLPRKVVGLMRILRREGFDVVQTHLFHSMVIGRIAGWFVDVPVRLSMIAGPFHLEAYTPRWIDRWTCWMETAVIASCVYTRTLYQAMGVPKRLTELVYYGPDPARFDPDKTEPADLRGEFGWEPDAPLVGMVAYFYTEMGVNRWTPPAVQGHANKRQEDFIHAARAILDRRPDVRFVLVGSGWEAGGFAYMDRMKALATSLGIDSQLRFTGFRTDVPSVLRGLDVAVQASLSENLGGTIESLLMACPTVATRTGGMVDSVIDGETGILVEPLDPRDLADGILRLLDDRELAARVAARGRAWMLERFTLDRTVDDLAAIYTARLRANPRGYRRWMVAPRMAVGGLFCVAIVVRFVLFDMALLPRWDAGWRPWTVWRYRLVALRYRLMARVNRLRFGMPKVSLPPLPALPKAEPWAIWPRIWLWRFYAFVGRNSSFGIRRRLHALGVKAVEQGGRLGAAAALWPKIWLWRCYAFVGRNSSFGIRRRLRAFGTAATEPAERLRAASALWPKIWLWRFYAFVGRNSSFGIRRRVRGFIGKVWPPSQD
jgi:glycosyltransferase involved in cell wall biosynthesis